MKRITTDEILINNLSSGDTNALNDLYHRYARKLYVFCMHTSPNLSHHEIEDLIHDIFVRVVKGANTYDPSKASVSTWLYTIARNCCIDLARRQSRFTLLPLDRNDSDDRVERQSDFENILISSNKPIENQVLESVLFDAIAYCIKEIDNGEELQALMLYYLEGKVYREIAEIIGRSISTVKNRVHSAQQKVIDCLNRKGFSSW